MSGSVNRVTLLGRLGKDPEVKYTQSGVPVAKFSLATDESWKDKAGEKQEKTEWHNVVAWGKLAEICEKYLEKGRQVYVEGKLETRSWEKDGVKRYSTEIRASSVVLLGAGGKPERESPADTPRVEPSSDDAVDDDISF